MTIDRQRRNRQRMARIQKLCILWNIGLAFLVVRLIWIAVVPGPIVHGPVVGAGSSRWQYDAEHFHLTMTNDGRGQIVFRDGALWSSPTSVDTNGSITPSVPSVAPELLGIVGRPDIWPNSATVVPEQGRNGLEASLDPLLTGHRPGERGVLQSADSSTSTPSAKSTFVLLPQSGATIVTTISKNKQRAAESLLAQSRVAHASIVSISLPTREVVVLASANHRKSDALHAVAPGSVLKIVTAAAALETHLVQATSKFDCDGQVHIAHVRMHCWKKHGHLSFTDAIAQSCDSVFATLGVRLGRQPIVVEAQRFGLLQSGLDQFQGKPVIPGAERGILFRQSGADAGLLANTAIGQEDVIMTPLEGALMAATIAQEGRYQPAALIREVSPYPTVFASAAVSNRRIHRTCAAFTADVIKRGMWQAVHTTNGTLYAFHNAPIYAKSGTAELPNGHVNAWMIGFRVQAGHPVEAFAFTVENESSSVAHKVLYQLARRWFSQVEGIAT